jgi:hypothetical protein
MIDYTLYGCPHCGKHNINKEFIRDVSRVKEFLSWVHGPIIEEIESGCRCWYHHTEIYSKIPGFDMEKIPKGSLHLIETENGDEKEGEAVDIRFRREKDGSILSPLHVGYIIQHHLVPLGAVKIYGIGAMTTTTHLDCRPATRRQSWIRITLSDGRKDYRYGVDFQLLLKYKSEVV